MEADKIIAEDKIHFPNCNYSISSSLTSTNKNGVFVSETIEKILRLCPGEKPVTVMVNSSKEESTSEPHVHQIPPFQFPSFSVPIDDFDEDKWFGSGFRKSIEHKGRVFDEILKPFGFGRASGDKDNGSKESKKPSGHITSDPEDI